MATNKGYLHRSFCYFFPFLLLVATATDQKKSNVQKTGLTEGHTWNIPGKVWSNYLQLLCNESNFCFSPQVTISTMSFDNNIGGQRSPVAEHFHLQNHGFNSHVSLCCIEHDAQWSDDTRKARESYWIRRLNTIQPHGINQGD